MVRKMTCLLKGLVVSYAVTGVLLLILAFVVYRFHVSEAITDLSIVAIYIMVTFSGGFVVGKKLKNHKYLWGCLLGFLYIVIITILAIILGRTFQVNSTANLTTVALCIGGGMLGGMLS